MGEPVGKALTCLREAAPAKAGAKPLMEGALTSPPLAQLHLG